MALFQDYVKEQEETCAHHHHSSSKKQKKKKHRKRASSAESSRSKSYVSIQFLQYPYNIIGFNID